MRVYRICCLCFIVLSGCASQPDHAPENKQVQREAISNRNDEVNQLSQGRTATVNTSQGALSVAPTVVALADGTSTTGELYYHDPWEGFNRTMFQFNHVTYRYALLPLADGYQYVVPAPVRDKIGNVFDNLREPLNLVNHAMTGEIARAGTNLGRFVINSTLGILGLFDPAQRWFDLLPQKQTLATTLQHYDIGAGPYVVLPILGPADPREAFSIVTEGLVHPVNYIAQPPETYQLRIGEGIDDFSQQSDTYRTLYDKADDPYIYFRNQYIQGQRRDQLFELGEQ
ncbi:VacJ family lipoprotein [Aestuariibacter sp. A3R04]|uniref:MlaA family lipoprotein n=1 Tax=Aestuariibacter sp. A3R04 TaxID=2841571 RepID=UPI001C098AE1|nr:VacJ family lipoprotein [Aestuariibacter sp. A3R04]MBU3023234.1 VacJ family lipoprotein [Aestuariibacter sp. A3R04]